MSSLKSCVGDAISPIGSGRDPVELVHVSSTIVILGSVHALSQPHLHALGLQIHVMAKLAERLNHDTSELIRLTGGSLSGVGRVLAQYHPYAGSPIHRFNEPFYPEPLYDHTTYRKPATKHTLPSGKCGFLSLPAEVRLMVYEQLTVRTRQDLFHKLYNFEYNGTVYRDEVKFTLVTKSVPGIALLATCKQISEEATSGSQPKVRLKVSRPRIRSVVSTKAARSRFVLSR